MDNGAPGCDRAGSAFRDPSKFGVVGHAGLVPGYPHVDDSLTAAVLAAIGASSDDGVESIVTAFRGWLPAGSTAKWAAIDRDERPPGADPRTALEARLAGSAESWSCWPFCTGLGGVLANLGHDVEILVEHLRAGHDPPLVDYHSALVVDGGLVDAYLGPSAPITPGHDVTRTDAWGSWVPGDRSDHLGVRGGSSPFRYRELGRHLDARDVTAFCEISTTHTGVGRRRTAHWLRDGALVLLREDDDGFATLRRTEGTGPFTQSRRVVARRPYDELHALVSGRGIPDGTVRS